MKTCWVHIGMHKTGSTSIQASLARARGAKEWKYVKLDERPNLNQAVFAMWDSNPMRNPLFTRQGFTEDQMMERRKWLLRKLARLLGRSGDGNFILSAEMASVIDEAGVFAMRDFLAARCDEVRVIGYVRAPLGFKNSIFQEQVKHGKGGLRVLSGPQYRFRFEKYDKAFGRENVMLRLFDPSKFPEGCVVADFCDQVDIDRLDGSKVQRVNESLCREACGMLYAYRKFAGYGRGEDVVRENVRLVEPMLAMRGRKFFFTRDFLKNSPEEAEDLAWMEERLGVSLEESYPDDADGVNGEEDLLRIERSTCLEFAENFQRIRGIAAPMEMLPNDTIIDPQIVSKFVDACRQSMRSRDGMEQMIERSRTERQKNTSTMKVCWIHIGMHKTGSTSIQESLARMGEGPGWTYVKLDSLPNLNRALFAMFDSNPQRHPIFVKQGLTPEQVAERRERLLAKLRNTIRRFKGGKLVLSTEMASLIDEAGVQRMRDFLAPMCDEIRVIGYVRPPQAFKNSLFQEQVKHGKGTLKNMTLPKYRMRFEKYDKAFGRENVLLREFNPAAFPNKCIVSDFCQAVGIAPPAADAITRVNESLSREACGILYAYRKLGPGYGVGEEVVKENNQLITPLLSVGGTKFRFSNHIIEKSAAEREDQAWMEGRLGVSLDEAVEEDGTEVTCEEDLLRVHRKSCEEYVEKFQKMYGMKVSPSVIPSGEIVDPAEVAAMLEHCRGLIRARNKARGGIGGKKGKWIVRPIKSAIGFIKRRLRG